MLRGGSRILLIYVLVLLLGMLLSVGGKGSVFGLDSWEVICHGLCRACEIYVLCLTLDGCFSFWLRDQACTVFCCFESLPGEWMIPHPSIPDGRIISVQLE